MRYIAYVDGKEIGTVYTDHHMTVEEVLYSIGYDLLDQEDLQQGYFKDVPGFYFDDGFYGFDVEAVELVLEDHRCYDL